MSLYETVVKMWQDWNCLDTMSVRVARYRKVPQAKPRLGWFMLGNVESDDPSLSL